MVIKPIGDSSTAIKYFEPALAGCMLHVTDEQVFAWNRIKEEVSAKHTKN